MRRNALRLLRPTLAASFGYNENNPQITLDFPHGREPCFKAKAEKRRKLPAELPEIRANSRYALEAVAKLKNGEIISEQELIALFKASSVEENDLASAIDALTEGTENRELLENLSSLYVEDPEIVL